MANNIIPNVSSGDLVGSTPTFPPNAVVRGDFLYLRDVDGNQIPGRTVSDGDEITVLFISNEKNIVLVQYPTSSGYRQGYVTNARSIIKYKDDYSWVNGSTPEPVYDFDKTTQIGTLDPRERAVVLYKVDGMTYVAYDTGKGKLTKSGLVHYEGAGSSTGGGSFNGVAPGEVVPGGFTYENNAEVVGDELYLRDANGNRIPGRSVSVGDRITVLDVSYSKQLALVQYPAGSVVRQGYVTNATNLIRYFKQGEWLNGSTTEPVLDENGGSLGSLSPYEAATPLYKKNGMIHVVYDTSKGPNTKSGYVKFEGLAQLPDTSIQIPSVSHSQATVDVYGTSGKGRPLKVYKIGNGSKVLFAGFAIHGWEDRWDNDGLALVNIANSLISKIGDYKAQNGLHGWTVYIAPCMNPDGVIVRGTNNGPGRCAVKSRIDMNRCFPRGFTAQYNSRNYTGPNPLGAQEAVALKEFIEKINKTADELVVIDGHGWLGCTYGDSSIAQYFTKQFGFSHNGPSGGGYFSYWAQGLPRTRGLLLEYPDTYSYGEVISRNYIGKTFNAIINILKNNPNGKAEDINTNSSTSKWEKKDNKWYYYENGNMVTGWKLVDGKWYYLESNGVMAIGWKELGGIWYYLNESGAMVKGWQTISGKTYYFNDSGHMLVGKQVIDGRNYNFNTSGQLDSTNWVKSNNKWYYYENGKMITGWKLINGEWYYLEGSGVMATGWKELGGIWYYLNESGAMVKGWQTISGKTYYFNDSGHMLLGKQTIDGKSYEFNGSGQLISDTGDISLSESTYIAEGEVIDVQTILNVRKGPGTNYDSIGQLHQGNKVNIVAKNGIWYKISSPIAGYVHEDFIKIKEASNSSEDKKSPSMEGFIEVLIKLYNIVESNYKSYSIKEKNEVVLDYLRKEEYSIRNGKLDGKVWSALFTPSKYEWLESKVDSSLKEQADQYTDNNNKIGKAKIEAPHLAATTLGYSKNNLLLSILPRYWTGWGGDFATLVGEVSNVNESDENKIYEKAMELLGGNSRFSDSDFYEDIDAIYFAKNLNTAPIYQLVKNYYNGLEYKRKELIIDDIGGDINIPLSKRIEDKFNGPHGLGFDKFRYGGSDLLGLDDLRGLGLRFFIYIGAGKGLSGGISAFQTEKYVKAVSKAFANKIETLQNGFLK